MSLPRRKIVLALLSAAFVAALIAGVIHGLHLRASKQPNDPQTQPVVVKG